MIEIHDIAPNIDVQPAEYHRLLGYPRGGVPSERAIELAAWARDWYGQHGRPWVYAREAALDQIGDGTIVIDGVTFNSTRLRNTLEAAGAHAAILVAVSAGPEIELEAQTRWREEKPDDYFFLEMYGSAVVEHLVTMTGARLCAWAETDGSAVLPHYSPGYPEWAIDEQPALLGLINRALVHRPVRRSSSGGGSVKREGGMPLEVLDSGMLRPKKSLLAVFGVTRHTDRVRRLTDLSPCENCSFAPCQYRRAPYRREVAESGDAAGRYSVSLKALKRWSEERLTMTTRADGTIDAVFRYEGTTCTNMGRALKFDYRVTVGPRDEGYPIRDQRCEPATGDEGYTSMCRYLTDAEELMTSIARERPLSGQPLDEVVRWPRPASPAGCYCEPASREHKWGLVLETIHFRLKAEATESKESGRDSAG